MQKTFWRAITAAMVSYPTHEFVLKNQYYAVDKPLDLKVVTDRPSLEAIIHQIQTARRIHRHSLDNATLWRVRYTLHLQSAFRVIAFRESWIQAENWRPRDVQNGYMHLVDLVIYHPVSGYASIYFVIYNLDRAANTEYMIGQCSVSLYRLKKMRQELLELERGLLGSAT